MSSALWTALTKVGREATKIVLPSGCVACGEALWWQDRVASCCERCWSTLPRLERACLSCAAEVALDDIVCLSCRDTPLATSWIASYGPYRGAMERVIHVFKFERHDFFDDPLSELLLDVFARREDSDFDVVIPVPMHRRKLRERGYNQAELLARHFARRSGIPMRRELLAKTKENATQSMLPRDERSRNVRDVFRADGKVKDRSVILVDDVCTTGETIRACTAELLRSGAKRVAALTLARA